jgi:MarR family transcriptional regulator, transcriptional regulator for hemolysin
MRPHVVPIGLDVSRTGRLLSRAFNDDLVAVGGSLPEWLVLRALKQGDHAMQRDLADAVGIEGATLTHHLNRMEDDGYVRRERSSGDRRSQVVTLTPAGEQQFTALLGEVAAFDEKLCAGFDERELAALRTLLGRLRANIAEARGSAR